MAIVTEWGSKDPFLINTTTDLSQAGGKVVALKNGTFFVTWQHMRRTADGLSFETDIYGQIFNADGTKKGDELVISNAEQTQEKPSVAVLNDGRIVVAWVSKNPDANGDIRAQVLNADGTKSGAEFAVCTLTNGLQTEPSVAALAGGGFVISWTSESISGTSPLNTVASDIRAQAFQAPVGTAAPERLHAEETSVNTTTTGAQLTSSIFGLQDGNYLVVFRDNSRSAEPNPTLLARILKPDGTNVVSEFLVSNSAGFKTAPSVTTLADGRFVITWQHDNAATGDNSSAGIKGQVFNADGTRSGGDFLINTSTQGAQRAPSIIALPDGGFAVAYTDFGPQPGIRVAVFNKLGLRSDEDYVYSIPTLFDMSGGFSLPAGRTAVSAISLASLEDGRLVLSWSETGVRSQDGIGVYGLILDPRNKGVTINGTDFDNSYIGTQYVDKIHGKLGADDLRGYEGDDVLIGGVGADKLDGGSGRDTASYADAEASVTASLVASGSNLGDASGDTYTSIENLTGSNHDDTLTGDDNENTLDGLGGNDKLVGGRGADLLIGGDSATDTNNNDTLDGGIGADTLIGGKGDDTYYVDDAADKITEAVGAGNDVVFASASYVLGTGVEIEEVRAVAGSGAINLTGNEFANKLYGNGAANELNGGGDADYMEGGAGDDTYYVDDQADAIVEGIDQGNDTVVISKDFASGSSYDLSAYENVESLRALNGAGDIALTGNTGANRITGNDGHNRLDGGLDAAIDILTGGKGNDTYVIRHQEDILVETAGEGTDTALVLTGNFTLGKDLSIEILQADTSNGVTNFNFGGNNLANTIKGADGDDILDGGGNATDAADRLEGGAGNDVYHVRRGSDVVVETFNGGTDDKVIAYASYTLGGSAYVETLEAAAGTANISLTGNNENNTLIGNAGSNVLEGRGGNDIIEGGGGDLDTAVFTGARAEYDVVWQSGGNVIVTDKQAGRDGSDLLKAIRYVRFSDQIIDLQAQTTLSIAAASAVKAEGSDEGFTDFTFTVTRSDTNGSPSAKWAIALDGNLTAADFDVISGTVNFAPGAPTAVITVRVRGDKLVEANESFTVTLSDANGATLPASGFSATGMILNDDILTTLSIAATDSVKSEGSGEDYTDFTFTVTRSDTSSNPTVKWSIATVGDLTADDFAATSGTVSFVAGETTAVITVRVRADMLFEGDESFTITLSDPEGAALGTVKSATGKILDDDFVNTAPDTVRLTTGGTIAWLDEHKAAGQVVATVTATDDGGTTGLRYYLVAESDHFEIDELTGQIRVKGGAVLDFEGVNTFDLNVVVRDQNGTGLEAAQTITINLRDLNEAPVLGATTTAVTIGENAAAGAEVASFTLLDPDAGEAFVYELLNVPAAFAGAFAVDPVNGKIVVADPSKLVVTSSQNFTLTLKVTDKNGGPGSYSDTQDFVITVQDIPPGNTAPGNIRLTTGEAIASIAENTTAGQVVARVMADDNGPASELRYSIASNDFFVIDQLTGEIKVKSGAVLDFENAATHTVAVTVRDLNGAGLTATQDITINLMDVNERATDIVFTGFTGAPSLKAGVSGKGTVVATAAAVDGDTKAEFKQNLYRFANGTTTDGLFTIDAATGQITTNRAVTAEDVGTKTFSVVTYDATNMALSYAKAQTVVIEAADNIAPSYVRLEGLTNVTVDEGTAFAGTLSAQDDGPAGNLSFVFDETAAGGGSANGMFVIDSETKQLKLAADQSLNFEEGGSYTVYVRAFDGQAYGATQALTITVRDVNEAATGIDFTGFTGTPSLKVGVSGAGAAIALATAVDSDTKASFKQNFYRFDNGQTTSADGLFVINATTGQITANRAVTAADVGTKTLNVVTYDATNASLSYTKAIQVAVAAEDNLAPTDIILSKMNVDENSPLNTVVAVLGAKDAQGAADIASYSIVTDEDGKFEIVGNELRLRAGINHEIKASHTVTIRVTDKGGESFVKTFTIGINDVNEAATGITFSNVKQLTVGVSGVGAAVAQAEADDPDQSTGFMSQNLYRFDNGQTTSADGLFVINAQTGKITTNRAVTADDIGTKTLTVVTYDAFNTTLAYTKSQEIVVAAIANAAPSDILLSSSAVDENSPTGRPVGILSATDSDVGDTFTFTIVNDPDSKFRVVGNELQVRADANLDYEAKTAHQVTVRVTDQGGLSYDKVFTITVNDVNETLVNAAPTGLALSNSFINEYDAVNNAVIGTLSASDPGDALKYSLVDNAGGLFRVDEGSGQLFVVGGLNFEAAASHKILVRATDTAGHSIDQVFTINVGDQLTLNKRGTKKNDKLNGSMLDDILKGGSGNGKDTVKGLAGDDQLFGESGNDKLYGGDGIDVLKGGKGNDQLRGEAGDDKLFGEDGNDLLYGGAGKDTFVFATKLNKARNLDTIKDFNVADDTIWLDNKIFKKLGAAGLEAAPAALAKDFFVVGKKAKDKNDYLVYDSKKGVLSYDVDGSGKKAAVEIAKIGKKLLLTEADFFVI